MTLPLGYTGSTVSLAKAAVFIPELWTGEVKRSRDVSFIMREAVWNYPSNFGGKKGDTIHIPSVSRLAVYDKITEQQVKLQSKTETDYSFIVDKYKEASFAIDNIVAVQADYDLFTFYKQEIAYALARDLDNYLLGLRAGIQYVAAQNIYCTNTGAYNGTKTGLTKAAIIAAKQALDEALVPDDGRRRLVISPAQAADLLGITEFISKDYQSGEPLINGMTLGTICGFKTRVSTNITTNSTTGYKNGSDDTIGSPTPGMTGSSYLPTQDSYTSLYADFHTAIACHPEWAVFTMQKEPNIEQSHEALLQADAIISTQVYGGRIYRSDHAVLIHTAS